MSHYSRVKSKITNRAALVKALEEMGFKGKVEVHDTAQALYGYENRARPETANVILRRKDVGGAANDVGFVLREDGTYEAIISDYDSGNHSSRKNDLTSKTTGYKGSWMEVLGQRYSYQVIKAQAEDQGYALTERYENGELVVTCDRGY